MDHEFSSSLVLWFWLMRVSHEVAIRMSAGLKSFEAQLSLEDPGWFLHLPGHWYWLLAGTLKFFPRGPFHGLLECLASCKLIPPEQALQERAPISFMTHPWKAYTVISAVSCWLHGSALFIIGGSCTGAKISGSRYPWRISWRMFTTGAIWYSIESHPRIIKTVS